MSSSKPATGKSKRYTLEQKQDILRRCAESGLSDTKFAKQEGVSTFSLHYWRKEINGTGQRLRKQKVAPPPDAERDINQLAVLNNAPTPVYIPPATGDKTLDERLGTVLGATIAEIIKRLR